MTNHRQAILSHLIAHIDQLTPTNAEMAALFGISMSCVDHTMSRLKVDGSIITMGKGGSRYFHFQGHKGHTYPRVGKVHDYKPKPAPVAMDRPQACPRCQARGCTRHSAGYLTTGVRLPVWASC